MSIIANASPAPAAVRMDDGVSGQLTPVKQSPAGDSPEFSKTLDDVMTNPAQSDGGNAARNESAEGGKNVPPDKHAGAEEATQTQAGNDTRAQAAEREDAESQERTESTPTPTTGTGHDAQPASAAESGAGVLTPAPADAGPDKTSIAATAAQPSQEAQPQGMSAAIAGGSASGDAGTLQTLAAAPRQPSGAAQPTGLPATVPSQTQATAAAQEAHTGRLSQDVAEGLELFTPSASNSSNRFDVTLLMALWRRGAEPQGDALRYAATTTDTAPVAAPVNAGASNVGVVSTGLPTLSINTPLTSADWQQSMGERIQWLMGQRLQGAEIRLNPAHLGPMEVKVQMHNDQASIQFLSSHQAVREALEAALPRLRDLLSEQGVELLNVDISDRSTTGYREEARDGAGHSADAYTGESANEDPTRDDTRRWHTPLIGANGVDLFV